MPLRPQGAYPCIGGRLPLFGSGPPAVLGPPSSSDSNQKHFIYVDNIGCFAGDPVRVGAMLGVASVGALWRGDAADSRLWPQAVVHGAPERPRRPAPAAQRRAA